MTNKDKIESIYDSFKSLMDSYKASKDRDNNVMAYFRTINENITVLKKRL